MPSPIRFRILSWLRAALGSASQRCFRRASRVRPSRFPQKTGIHDGNLQTPARMWARSSLLSIIPWDHDSLGLGAQFLFSPARSVCWGLLVALVCRGARKHVGMLFAAELAYIQSDPRESVTRVKWLSLLYSHRQTWAFVAGKFMIDPIWWFCLSIPDFLQRKHGLALTQIGLPLVVVRHLRRRKTWRAAGIIFVDPSWQDGEHRAPQNGNARLRFGRGSHCLCVPGFGALGLPWLMRLATTTPIRDFLVTCSPLHGTCTRTGRLRRWSGSAEWLARFSRNADRQKVWATCSNGPAAT